MTDRITLWCPTPGRLDPDLDLTLEPGALHLWRIDTGDGGADLDTGWTRLSDAQRARVESRRHRSHRARYIRALAGLNRILAAYLDRPPRQIQIQRGPTGKPYLDGADNWLSFSFSHSGDLALVGLSTGPDAALGVDCEWIRPRENLLTIARRLFEPATVAALETAPESERLERFHVTWTALEADVKCDGRGLFRQRPPGTAAPEIAHVIPAPGYIAAVARARLPPLVEWRLLEFRD